MQVPMCRYETHGFEYQDHHNRWVCEAVAMHRPCGCAGLHTYQAFEERIQSNYPKLRLGVDRVNNRWIVYTWSPQIERVKAGPGLPTIAYMQRFLDIIIDCKWAIEEKTNQRGRRVRYEPRMYGNWVLRELARFDPRRMTPDQDWVSGELNQISKDTEDRVQATMRKEAEDIVADAMTLADRGNPWFLRKQFRQRKTVAEVANDPG